MRSRLPLAVVFLALLALSQLFVVHSQNPTPLWQGILSPGRAINWQRSTVGVPGGIPSASWSQCGSSIAAYGQNPNPPISGTVGNVATINNTLNACPNNTYVLLGPGDFWLNGPPVIQRSNVVLRGSGPNSTTIFTVNPVECVQGSQDISICGNNNPPFLNPNDCVGFPSVPTCPGNAYAFSWIGGYAQGSTQITITNVGSGGINNGEIITLDQANTIVDTGGLNACSTGPGATPLQCTQQGNSYAGRDIGGYQWNQQQHVRVTAGCASTCTGGGTFNLTIQPGLYAANWNTNPGGVGGYFVKPISNSGIENMTIDNSVGQAESNIGLDNCDGCWIKNVVSLHGNRNHVWAGEVTHSEIRDSYFYATLHGLIESYGIEMFDSSDNLTENNIFQQIASPNIGAGADEGNVFAFNFWIDNYYTGDSGAFMQLTYMGHDAGNNFNLFEGNQGNALAADDVHGTSGQDTVFRNWLNGRDYNTAGGGGNQPTADTYPIDLDAGNRGYNFLGNVLGTPGYHNQYQTDPVSGGAAQCNTSIWYFGWSSFPCTMFNQSSTNQVKNDPLVAASTMRWCNYDVVTGAVRANAAEASPSAIPFIPANTAPANCTLPPSFFYLSKPGFFPTAQPWPSIGPDVFAGTGPGGFAYRIPAANCYYSTLSGPTDGSGDPLPFDANSCPYAAGGGGGGSGGVGMPVYSVSSSTVNFGTVNLGSQSAVMTITITNGPASTANLVITLPIDNGNESEFPFIANQCGSSGGSLPPGTSCTMQLQFGPTAIGTRSTTITINDNAPGAPHSIALTGFGQTTTSPSAPVNLQASPF